MGIGECFNIFCSNLRIQNADSISYRYKRITRQFNLDFYNIESDASHSIYTGSYGRDTAINGASDVDMLFWLPSSDYTRFNNYQGNGQSALLQEFRNSISNTYPSSEVSGDGQVVVVVFTDGLTFEIAPGFELKDGGFRCPYSGDGGRWYDTYPRQERDEITVKNSTWNGNLKRLAQMARAWKDQWAVPMSGLLIDTLAHNFLRDWAHKDKSYLYYDWISRDFFEYLKNQNQDQSYWYAPGSNQLVYRKGNFEYKALRCYNISIEAIEAERKGNEYTRNQKWREIYGTKFPL
jgi:hypothetical protein